MSDDHAFTIAMVGVTDRFVAAMAPALGDSAQERGVVEQALEDYRATRRAYKIWPEDEFQSHFFLADSLSDRSGVQLRGAAVDELGLAEPERSRISDLFLDVLGI